MRTWEDACANLTLTGADGVMSAEGILDNPALFLPSRAEDAAASGAGVASGATGGPVAVGSTADDDAEADGDAAREARKLRKKLREIERLMAMGPLSALAADAQAKVAKKQLWEAQLERCLEQSQSAPAAADVAAPEVDAADAAARKARKLRKRLREIERLSTKEGALSEEEQAKVAHRAKLCKKLKRCEEQSAAGSSSAAAVPKPAASPAPAASATLSASSSLPTPPSPLTLALEYLELAERWSVPIRTVVFHTRRIAKQALMQFQLMAEMLEAKDVATARALVKQCVRYETDGYTPDPEKARREREALELKKWREATRKRFEERMVRKALRAGLPRDHYLSQGAEVPTAEGLRELRAMAPAAAWERWTSRHGQHCWAMHMGESGCTRERTCAFLHVDVASAASEPRDLWHG